MTSKDFKVDSKSPIEMNQLLTCRGLVCFDFDFFWFFCFFKLLQLLQQQGINLRLVYTMNHVRWPFSRVWLDGPTFTVRFLKNQFTKQLRPSLGANRMWTKRSDLTPKSECVRWVFFLRCMPKRAILNKFKFDHALVFFGLRLLFPKKKSFEFYYKPFFKTFLCHGPLLFLLEYLFCLSHRKTRWTMWVDNVGLRTCLLGTWNFMVTLTFLSLV